MNLRAGDPAAARLPTVSAMRLTPAVGNAITRMIDVAIINPATTKIVTSIITACIVMMAVIVRTSIVTNRHCDVRYDDRMVASS